MERVCGRQEKMEGHCSKGHSPQWVVAPMEEEEEGMYSGFRPFFVPVHVGNLQALCAPQIDVQVMAAFYKVSDCPQTNISNILSVQEKGTLIGVSECRHNFTLTQNTSRGFLLCSTTPTLGNVSQPLYVEVSSHCDISSTKAANYPGLPVCVNV